jgi:hypothetical protein
MQELWAFFSLNGEDPAGEPSGVEDAVGSKRKRDRESLEGDEEEGSDIGHSIGVEIGIEELEQLRDFLKKKLLSLIENERM